MERYSLPCLRPDRVHEVTGPSATAFAAMQASERQVIWIEASGDRVYAPGLRAFIDPQRILFIHVDRQRDALRCMEEALRMTKRCNVIARLSDPVGLTESRRLQLAAAESGGTGLCLVPDEAQGNAAETRWRSTPIFRDGYANAHRWDLIKNKKGITGSWEVTWNAKTHRINLVSAPIGGMYRAENAPVFTALRNGDDTRERLAALLGQPHGGRDGSVFGSGAG